MLSSILKHARDVSTSSFLSPHLSFRCFFSRIKHVYCIIISITMITVEHANPIPRIAKANANCFNVMTSNFVLFFSFSLYLILFIVDSAFSNKIRWNIWASKSHDIKGFNFFLIGQSFLIKYTTNVFTK